MSNEHYLLLYSIAGSLIGQMLFRILPGPRAKAKSVRHRPGVERLKHQIFSKPFGGAKKRKPIFNDDNASWRKENEMDLKDE